MVRHNPNSENIFEDNVLDTFYPQRPASLDNVCLYDFVAKYEFQGIDTSGQRVYRKLTKPKLPNHKIFDPEKEDQRQDYFYSLVLLFSQMRVVCCKRMRQLSRHFIDYSLAKAQATIPS